MSKKLKPFIFGMFKSNHGETFKTNKDDSILIWQIECDMVKAMSIHKRVAMYDQLVKGVFNKKIVQKAIKKYCKPGDDELVRKMLKDHTQVKILKEGEQDGI